jgi:hypothetical protein
LFKIKYILKGSEKSKKKKNMPLKFILFILLLLAYTWSSELEKSEIQEIGNEKLVYGKDTVHVKVRMQRIGQTQYFHKSGKEVEIDSTVNPNGTYYVSEHRGLLMRYREESCEQTFHLFDEQHHLIQCYTIGMKKEKIYDKNGNLYPVFKEVRGDTVFWDLDYKDDGKFIN